MGERDGPRALVLGDGWVVALATAAAVGARWAGGPGRLAGAAVLVVGLVARRACVLVLGVLVLAGGLAAAALDGLDPPEPGRYDGWATLVSDPEEMDSGGVRVLVRVDDRRVEVLAFGRAAALLGDRLAGEDVELAGTLRPREPVSAWALARRIVGRLTVDEVGDHRASVLAGVANAMHRALDRGADHLPTANRALLTGVVLGDDRALFPEVVDDFRGAGLGHLTAVSGQNLAVLLAAAGPLLRRLRWGIRLPATLGLLALFAVVVRVEPSVLRAAGMAAVATTAAAAGRPAEGIRVLALAVTGLLLVDPLLVHSLGFALSTCASAAIVLLAPRIRVRVPAPPWLADPLAVTLAAQVGVTPLLLGRPDGMPVAAVPANLLAVPAAGALTVWGLTAGLLAGALVGAAAPLHVIAGALHVPTSLLAWWTLGVARWAAGLPLAVVRPAHAVVVVATVVLASVARRRSWRHRASVIAVAVAVVVGGLADPRSPSEGATAAAGAGATLWSAEGAQVLVVDESLDAARTLAALRGLGARCVDVVAVAGGGRAVAAVAAALLRRCPTAVAVAAAGQAHPGWLALAPGEVLAVGPLRVQATHGRLAVSRGPPPR